MEAVVLAGGFGSRLRQVVSDVPKPMAPVAGRPFLEYLLSSLAMHGFKRVILSVGYLAEIIVSHFGELYQGLELFYEIENTPLGTGGAVRAGIQHCRDDHVFIFNGDTFLNLEISSVETHWQLHGAPIIVAREVSDTARYGRLNVQNGRVVGFFEKGTSVPGLINAGCYVLSRHSLDSFAVGLPFSLETDFLANAIKRMSFNCFVTQGHFIDIGVPEDYERAQTELALFMQ